MRVLPIYSNNIYNKPRQNTGGNFSTPNAQISFGSKKPIKDQTLSSIIKTITQSDASRLDGTIQGVYQHGPFMAKAPDINSNTPIKEFYALSVLNQASPDNRTVPKPYIMAKTEGRHFIVEEFIKGEYSSNLPVTLSDTKKTVQKIAEMDKAGIVNCDISPRNIIMGQDGQYRILDFDNFAFLNKDGLTSHSGSMPAKYFASRIPASALQKTDFANTAGTNLSEMTSYPPKRRFANSFTLKRTGAKNSLELYKIRNMSENPYINVPSNLASYEGGTIYRRIVDNDIDNPVEFLRNYIKVKAQTYHPKMKEFLESLAIDCEYCDTDVSRVSFSQAKEQLKQAIDYENFLIKMFANNEPDVYFAKLEAAKMQLNALLSNVDVDKRAANSSQIGSAYDKLIKVIADGLEMYKDPDCTKYLETELKKYQHAFENTKIPFNCDTPILDHLDILQIWFSDSGADHKSFSAVKDNVKNSCAVLIKADTDIEEAASIISPVLKSATKNRLSDTALDNGSKIIAKELIENIKTAALPLSSAAQAPLNNSVVESANDAIKNLAQNSDNAIEGLTTNVKRFFGEGNTKKVAVIGALLSAAGLIAYKQISKNKDN